MRRFALGLPAGNLSLLHRQLVENCGRAVMLFHSARHCAVLVRKHKRIVFSMANDYTAFVFLFEVVRHGRSHLVVAVQARR